MYKLKIAILFVVTLALTNSFAEAPTVSVDELASTKSHEKITQIITHIINSYHYILVINNKILQYQHRNSAQSMLELVKRYDMFELVCASGVNNQLLKKYCKRSEYDEID